MVGEVLSFGLGGLDLDDEGLEACKCRSVQVLKRGSVEEEEEERV